MATTPTSTTPPSATRARTRRTQAERRRDSERKLLDAAAHVIAEKGSAKASFAEIAAAAGQSHSNPHYLFGSKANLLEALVAEFSTRYGEEVVRRVGDETGLDAILLMVKLFVRGLRNPLTMTRAFYVLLGESVSTAPELRDGLNGYHRWLQGLLADWIRDGIAGGEIRADLDVDASAAVCLAGVRGIGFLVLNDPEAHDLEAVEVQILDQIERTLRA